MSALVLHCGGKPATRQAVEDVPVPERTESYVPVPHWQLVSLVREQVESTLSMPILSESFGLNKEGQQMFAVLKIDTGNPDDCLAAGIRNSYDKSLSAAMALGANVFVCDNLAFSGSAVTVFRKHTRFVWQDLPGVIQTALQKAGEVYADLQKAFGRMKAEALSEKQGYALLGVAQGEGVLSSRQMTKALVCWQEPEFEVFKERNWWSLYNAITSALKEGNAGGMIDRHVGVYGFVTKYLQ